MSETIEAKHTPGDWKSFPVYPMEVTKDGTLTVHRELGLSGYGVSSVFRDDQNRRCTVVIGKAELTRGRESEAEANARLIAAAPEMLVLLQKIANYHFDKAFQKAAATVVAKALGQDAR